MRGSISLGVMGFFWVLWGFGGFGWELRAGGPRGCKQRVSGGL